MGITYSLIAELDEAMQSGSSDRRMATLRRVTDLFLSQAGLYESEQIELFDDVLLRLIDALFGFCAGSCGSGGAKVDWTGTMTSALQFGHGAVSPIWAHVAERCWPHVGHPNLTSGAGGGGNVRVFGTATGALQFEQRIVTPI